MNQITEKDLALNADEVRELVEGAQQFLAPVTESQDDERLVDRLALINNS